MKKIIVEMNQVYKMIDNSLESPDKCTGCVFTYSEYSTDEDKKEDKSILCDNSDICFVMNGIWEVK